MAPTSPTSQPYTLDKPQRNHHHYDEYDPAMLETQHHIHDLSDGKWSNGLFDCFDHCVPNCLMVTFCTCISLGQIAHRINMMHYLVACIIFFLLIHTTTSSLSIAIQFYYQDIWDQLRSAFDEEHQREPKDYKLYGKIFYITYILLVLLVAYMRYRVRRYFKIEGDLLGDCFVSFCCGTCATAQMATHVKSYRAGCCSFLPPDRLPAYKS